MIRSLLATITAFFKREASSFAYLNTAQFLGALNDQIFKWLLIFMLIDIKGAQAAAGITAFAGAIFVIPFLLFSAASGSIADRLSKRNIIVFSKGMEVAIMVLGVIGFALRVEWLLYFILFMMAAQSTLFGPSKYGIMPEIVESKGLAKANGIMTSFTFLAMILGTFAAAVITEVTGHSFVLAGLVCCAISIAGLISSYGIEHTPPGGCTKPMSPFFFADVFRTLRAIRHLEGLTLAIFSSCFAFFAAAFIQINIIPFAMETMGLSETQGGYLFLVCSLGIGVGAALAGRISGERIEMGLLTIGGIGMAVGGLVLLLSGSSVIVAVLALLAVGLGGGFFSVPADAYIQQAAPAELRGQVVAASNFLAFVGVLFASILIALLQDAGAWASFAAVTTLILVTTLAIAYKTRDYVFRLGSRLVLWFGFKLKTLSRPKHAKGAVLIYHKTSILDALVMMGTQDRCVRFLVDEAVFTGKWPWLLRCVTLFIPAEGEARAAALNQARALLDKGRLLCTHTNLADFHSSFAAIEPVIKEVLKNTDYAAYPVYIYRQRLSPSRTLLAEVMRNLRSCVIVTQGAAVLVTS